MNNSRFSVSIHILTLLAKAGEQVLSSEYIAGSININPVLVRKELMNLRKHKLIITREGKNGGSGLSKAASQVYLADIYNAVNQTELLGRPKNKPNPHCPVGKQIDRHLNNLFSDAEKALINQLGKMTLKKFSDQFD